MSSYDYYSFHFVMRADQESAYRVLSSVAAGTKAEAAVVSDIHPVARYFLEDPTRFLDDESEPRIGVPVRLAHDRATKQPRLSIEFCMHDDSFADGGYMFWLWVLSLVEPPRPSMRSVIGYDGIYRNDHDMGLTVASAEAITDRHDNRLTYEQIYHELADWSRWETWGREQRES